MKRLKQAWWVTILLAVGIVLLGAVSAWAQVIEVWVDDDFDSSTDGWETTHWDEIQEGVDAVAEGGMVIVAAGTYDEVVTIDKSLMLNGPQAGMDPRPSVGERTGEEAVIDGGGNSPITVTADDVVIDGFTLTNAGSGSGHGSVSISPSQAHISVRNNAISQSGYGVWVDDHSQNVLVEKNVISDCYRGVYARECSNDEVAPTITKNDFYDNVRGIFVYHIHEGESQVVITDNYFEELTEYTTDYGIYSYSSSFLARGNTFVNIGTFYPDFYTYPSAICGLASTTAPGWQNIKRSVIEGNVITATKTVAIMGYFSDFLVRNNEITRLSSGYAAIWIKGGTGYDPSQEAYAEWTIENNDITGPGNSGDGIYATGGGYGQSALSASGNTITGFANGVRLVVDNQIVAKATIQGNTIMGNSSYGITNAGTNPMVDASANWWGTTDPAAVDAMVAGNVDFTPMVNSGVDGDSDTPGWQPDLSSVTVHTLGQQVGATGRMTGRISEAVDLVPANSTVNVAGGTYDESLVISAIDGLTLQGSGATATILEPSGAASGAKIIDIIGGDIVVDGFTFDFQHVAGNRVAIYCTDASVAFRNNTFKNLSASDAAGNYTEIMAYVKAPNLTDASRAKVVFQNNTFIDAGRVAVLAHYYVNLTVQDNVFMKSVDDFGYAIELGSQAVGTIVGNVIYGYDTPALLDGSVSGGIYIENCFTFGDASHVDKWVTVLLNEIYGNQMGICVGNEWDNYAGDVDILVTSRGNSIHDNSISGVQIADEDRENGSSVTYLAFENSLIDNGEYGYYVYTNGDGQITVQVIGDIISGHDVGFYAGDFALGPTGSSYDISIHGSSISGNAGGLLNELGGSTIDASLNWWGDADGPSGEGPGAGDSVSANVIYSPWLAYGTDTDPGTPGWQLPSPMLFIVDHVGPKPTTENANTGYLNMAIWGSNDLPGTDTIEVRHGTYDASEPITEGVNLFSVVGSAAHTSLSGTVTVVGLNTSNVTIGDGGKGFSILDGVTVIGNASNVGIHWNDIFGPVNNYGTGTLSAIYNYWGSGSGTSGSVNTSPTLPMRADKSWGHATAIMGSYGVSLLEAVLVLPWVADGYSHSDALQAYLGGGGIYGSIQAIMNALGISRERATEIGAEYNNDLSAILAASGVAWANPAATLESALHAAYPTRYAKPAGGGGAYLGEEQLAGAGGAVVGELAVEGVYQAGEPIDLSFQLFDDQTGEPLVDANVNATICKVISGEDGGESYEALNYYGLFDYNEATGVYSHLIDTSDLEPGYYDLWLGFSDGTSERIRVEIVAS